MHSRRVEILELFLRESTCQEPKCIFALYRMIERDFGDVLIDMEPVIFGKRSINRVPCVADSDVIGVGA